MGADHEPKSRRLALTMVPVEIGRAECSGPSFYIPLGNYLIIYYYYYY